jgi:chemotaxis protein methyltransferase CheR
VAQTWITRVNDSQADHLGLSSSALPLLRDLIHERTGVFFDHGRYDLLRDRLAPLVVERGFESFLDYFYLLKYDEGAAEDWGRVTDALAVPETYFWREMDQIHGVVTHVVPGLAKARTFEPLRIWSVPSASGEEPLTIAMRLEEEGWFDRVPIEIHGSDASPAAIARARAGRYRERSFRALPPALREKYFRQDGDAWTVTPALQRRVTSWSVVNLLDDHAGRRADRLLPERVHLFLGSRGAPGRRSLRRRDAGARVSLRRRVGIAPAGDLAVRARGNRRRVRVREAPLIDS